MDSYPRDLRFVSQDEDMQGATFYSESEGGEIHLNNVQIQQHGLVDLMRAALVTDGEKIAGVREAFEQARRQHNERMEAEQGSGHPTNGADTTPVPAESPRLLGGYTTEWRWQVVQDGELTLLAIDNQPAIRAHDDVTAPAPQLQKIVIPYEILRVIAGD